MAGFDLPSGNAPSFSDDEIEQVPQGTQPRIITISVTQPTIVLFDVDFNGQFCCTTTDANLEVENRVKTSIQAFYDTGLLSARRESDERCRTKLPPQSNLSQACEDQRVQFMLHWSGTGVPEVDTQQESARTNPTETAPPLNAAPITYSHDGLPRLRHSNEVVNDLTAVGAVGRNHNDSSVRTVGMAAPSPAKPEPKIDVNAISLKLFEKIIKGMTALCTSQKNEENGMLRKERKVTKKLGLSPDEAHSYCDRWKGDPIETFVSHFQPGQSGKYTDEEVLEELENAFLKVYKRQHQSWKRKSWTTWYFAGCANISLHARGIGKLDQNVGGIRILHRIVDTLFPTLGVKALMVICAAAAKSLNFGRLGRLCRKDHEEIGDNVAEKIQKALTPPPQDDATELQKTQTPSPQDDTTKLRKTLTAFPKDSMIPFPSDYIRYFLNISHADACTSLGLGQLASVPFESVLVERSPGIFEPQQSYQYSIFEARGERWRKSLPSETEREAGGPNIDAREEDDLDQEPHLEGPQGQSLRPPPEGVEVSDESSQDAESNDSDGTSSTTSNGTTVTGHEDSDAEPEEGPRKRRRVDGACTDNPAEGEDVILRILPDSLIPGDGAPDPSTDFNGWLDYLETTNITDMPLDNDNFWRQESEHDIQGLNIDDWLDLGDGFPTPHW